MTLSAGGPGRLIDCMKCSACGWSVTADRGDAPTRQQIMNAIDEHTAASRAWSGHGPEVTAKRAIVAQMLADAGIA